MKKPSGYGRKNWLVILTTTISSNTFFGKNQNSPVLRSFIFSYRTSAWIFSYLDLCDWNETFKIIYWCAMVIDIIFVFFLNSFCVVHLLHFILIFSHIHTETRTSAFWLSCCSFFFSTVNSSWTLALSRSLLFFWAPTFFSTRRMFFHYWSFISCKLLSTIVAHLYIYYVRAHAQSHTKTNKQYLNIGYYRNDRNLFYFY